MERKLERCIRLRFVSLCTCVCTCMSMCGNDLPSFDQSKTSIDRRKKKYFCLLLLILLWKLSLGGKLLPFLGGRRWRWGRRRRMPCRRRLLRWWELLPGFVSKFCVCVCVLLASWWFKLSMRLLVFLVRAGGKLSESERGSRSVCISAHTLTVTPGCLLCVCARFEPNRVSFSPRNFLLQPKVCLCATNFPVFFLPKSSGFPLICLYFVLTFELCLCLCWFCVVPKKLSPSLCVFAVWHFECVCALAS